MIINGNSFLQTNQGSCLIVLVDGRASSPDVKKAREILNLALGNEYNSPSPNEHNIEFMKAWSLADAKQQIEKTSRDHDKTAVLPPTKENDQIADHIKEAFARIKSTLEPAFPDPIAAPQNLQPNSNLSGWTAEDLKQFPKG